LSLKSAEQQMKFLNSNLIEFLLRILQVDSMKIKVETLKVNYYQLKKLGRQILFKVIVIKRIAD
jgi:hypothetical protein